MGSGAIKYKKKCPKSFNGATTLTNRLLREKKSLESIAGRDAEARTADFHPQAILLNRHLEPPVD
ncbi:MAG TPA: hypothetical protein DCY88_18255 [Cyanobacteria bacterium UBA11372]|nr:hypothetical protein [Cyanobacteria bacterium UBA11372]